MSRSLKAIRQDLERVDRQIESTLHGKFQTEADRQITLEGFMKKKTALTEERRAALQSLTDCARNIKVNAAQTVSASGSAAVSPDNDLL